MKYLTLKGKERVANLCETKKKIALDTRILVINHLGAEHFWIGEDEVALHNSFTLCKVWS